MYFLCMFCLLYILYWWRSSFYALVEWALIQSQHRSKQAQSYFPTSEKPYSTKRNALSPWYLKSCSLCVWLLTCYLSPHHRVKDIWAPRLCLLLNTNAYTWAWCSPNTLVRQVMHQADTSFADPHSMSSMNLWYSKASFQQSPHFVSWYF
jgi:hypothetical protein